MPRTSARLTGKRCQCSACGEFFSALTAFDKHRVGVAGDRRVCANPASFGMVIKEVGGNTFWGESAPEGYFEGRSNASP